MAPLSRRSFLIGGASAAVLAACGGNDSPTTATEQSTTTAPASGLIVYRVFAPQQPVGDGLRLPIALAGGDEALLDSVPPTITYRYGPEGGALGDEHEAARHDEGVPTPYFPLRLDLDATGVWQVEVSTGDGSATTTLQAVPRSEAPAVPGSGESLIPLATPTVADHRGVEPICTRDPECPFHDQTLESAMAGATAVAFLISTPKFCQTAICGPVLDLLVERHEDLGDRLAVVHAEVYVDETARTTTEAVQAYGLTWEPSLFVARADGTITSRLDYTYDGVELDEVLQEVLG